jgi:hypothetical protein
MVTAIVGLLGVIIGLAVGWGYTFWSTVRSEFGEAVAATAVLSEALRASQTAGEAADDMSLAKAWRKERRALVIHMSPEDFYALADSFASSADRIPSPFPKSDLQARIERLHAIFWEEHQAFILVPLIHYLSGNTISKRIRETLDPAVNIACSRPKSGRQITQWHRPPPLT